MKLYLLMLYNIRNLNEALFNKVLLNEVTTFSNVYNFGKD